VPRIIPRVITSLGPSEIFVFGSNLAGIHGAGAAHLARKQFGAVYGVGVGPSGRSYAIPTKDERIITLPLDRIQQYVSEFVWYATMHQNSTFLLTPVGCGLAGYTHSDIAPLFKGVPQNVHVPAEWVTYLES
jgi:hypothetical protein